MTTNLSLITDALRSVNVLDETETASSEQGAHCLREMNQMLSTWEVLGIVLGYFAQTNTTSQCPIPDWAEKGVKYKLALQIAPHYGAQVPISTAANAEDGYRTIQTIVMNQQLQGSDMSHLPAGAGNRRSGGNDFYSGN